MASNGVEKPAPIGGTAIKPVGWDRTGWEAFKYLLYDPQNGTVLTRTPLSWLKITVFYMIYYSLLAAFWLGCLHIFFMTLPDGSPRWTLEESLIGSNPGVGIKPAQSDFNIASSMFIFDSSDTSTVPTDMQGEGEKNADILKRMDIFLEKYANSSGLHECADNNDENKGNCIFDTSVLGECANNNYGYIPVNGMVKPCFFLKLNKIFDFDPVVVDAAKLDEPEYDEMSAQLKAKIKETTEPNQIFFDCFGRYPADLEAVTLNYFPSSQGVSSKFFPYTGGNYQSPLLAVQVEIPETNKGQLVHIECRAWFEGVKHVKKDKMGLTQFEVLIN